MENKQIDPIQIISPDLQTSRVVETLKIIRDKFTPSKTNFYIDLATTKIGYFEEIAVQASSLYGRLPNEACFLFQGIMETTPDGIDFYEQETLDKISLALQEKGIEMNKAETGAQNYTIKSQSSNLSIEIHFPDFESVENNTQRPEDIQNPKHLKVACYMPDMIDKMFVPFSDNSKLNKASECLPIFMDLIANTALAINKVRGLKKIDPIMWHDSAILTAGAEIKNIDGYDFIISKEENEIIGGTY